MSEERKVIEEQIEKPISLKEFIDEYQRTITVIGVFVALGLFWKTVYHNNSIPYISYLCFLITIPLLLEVWRGYNAHKATLNLRIFIMIFQGIFLFTAFNLIMDYPQHFATIVSGAVWTITFLSLVTLTEKIGRHFKDTAYNKALEVQEDLIKNNVLLDKRNKTLTRLNIKLETVRNIVNVVQMFLLIPILIITFIAFLYTDKFFHGISDMIENKEIIVVPPNTDANSTNR